MRIRYSQEGAMSGTAISLILCVILLLGTIGFAAWAFVGRQDYKNNTDEKVAKAVDVAIEQTKTDKDNEFVEKEKEPYRKFEGPSDLGSVSLLYPKTWSVYESTGNGDEANFIFNPKTVNGNDGKVYALRITVTNSPYNEVVQDYDDNIQNNEAKARVYKLKKVPESTGVRIDGKIDDEKQGSVVILPLRDKTIKIAVESQDFVGDFDKIILPNFTFSP